MMSRPEWEGKIRWQLRSVGSRKKPEGWQNRRSLLRSPPKAMEAQEWPWAK